MGPPADGGNGNRGDRNEMDLTGFAALALDLALPDACIPGVQACLQDLSEHAGRLRALVLPDSEPSA